MKIPTRILLTLAACLILTNARAALTVASLSTVTTDLAREVGGTNVTVLPIIKPGIDPHEFEPTPGDVAKVSKSDLVVFTGKGMEGYLTKLEDSSGHPSKFTDLGRSIPSLTMVEDGKTVEDPHWWHSIPNMKRAVRTIEGAFSTADPGHAAEYRANAAAYLGKLTELERWSRVKIAELPKSRRILVTSHDALGYFAKDNGFVIHPIKGISTTEEPSSSHVRELIDTIRREGVKAVFFENIENPRAVQQIARETGAKTGGELYSDGLGNTAESSTYEAMMRHNISTIVDSLK